MQDTMAANCQPAGHPSAASSSQQQTELRQLTKHLSSVDGELARVREMTEQLEACLLDDLRDLGSRLDAAEAANGRGQVGDSEKKPAMSQSEPASADQPGHAAAAQLQALMEKRLRRVEVTMAGIIHFSAVQQQIQHQFIDMDPKDICCNRRLCIGHSTKLGQ